MDKERTLQLLHTYLKSAQENINLYSLVEDILEKEKIIKDFLNDVSSLLDYTITEFPTDRNYVKNKTFSRDALWLSEKEYKKKIHRERCPSKLQDYLLFCYKLNVENYNILFYVIWWHKHRDVIKNLKKWNQYTLEWSITTYNSHQNPIQSDKNGWFIIGNAISIWHNVNIEMNNCVIQTANEVMIVNQLKSSTITIKWKIVSLKWKDFDFVSWAMDIINILWKIILHYKLQVLHLS